MDAIRKFLRSEEGPTAVEYAVLLAMILVVAVSSIAVFGGASGGMWGGIQTSLSGAGFGS